MNGDYVTIQQVREEAGFTGNVNVSDEIIEDYLISAESEVKAFIGRRYSMPLTKVPALVVEISKQLAAGLLLLKEYGTEAEGTTKDGLLKIQWARKRLLQISRGQITLYDEDDVELPRVNSIGAAGYPNKRANDIDPPLFRIGQKF